jgi:hypothetical protein
MASLKDEGLHLGLSTEDAFELLVIHVCGVDTGICFYFPLLLLRLITWY